MKHLQFQMYSLGSSRQYVSYGSGNGLVPTDTKPLLEPVLIKINIASLRYNVFREFNHLSAGPIISGNFVKALLWMLNPTFIENDATHFGADTGIFLEN